MLNLSDSNCIFCKIVNKEIASSLILESNSCVSFSDISPIAPFHILVVPKIHVSSIEELLSMETGNQTLLDMIRMANEISSQENILENGYRLVINRGKYGGQAVNHLHIHVIGGRQMKWPPG